jgi:FemAB-related protein (PEP-CTERM system-associated)
MQNEKERGVGRGGLFADGLLANSFLREKYMMTGTVKQAITSEDRKLWQDYIEKHPEATHYHDWEWRDVVEGVFQKKTHYLMAEAEGKIEGVLPLVYFKTRLFGRFLVSYPYVNYGGILAENPAAQDVLLQAAQTLANELKVEFVELRHRRQMDEALPLKTHKVTFLLPLPANEEDLWKSFKSKLRSQIRRPMKEDMYGVSGDLNLLNDFYYIFCRNMRDLGTPVYAKAFFKSILQHFPKRSAIVVVYSKDKHPVAAAFLLMHRDTVEIPWASSLREYNRFGPNMLLYWEALRFAATQGYKCFDFGRCSPDSGTYHFKKQWDAEEKPLYWYYILAGAQTLPEINPDNPKYALMVNAWRKMPLFFTNAVGPAIVKHIP